MKLVADPVAWTWFALLGSALFCFMRRRRRRAWWLLAIALAGSVFQAAEVPGRLIAGMERPFLPPAPGQIAPADAVIVLGGSLTPFEPSYLRVEFCEASDRLLTGIGLVRDGKAPVLVVSGGGEGQPARFAEAPAAMKFIERWNLVTTPIESLGVSRTTHDEAVHAARLASQKGWKKIILVSSALHLRRAAATFRKAGLEVVPVGCDFRVLGLLEPGRQRRFNPVPSVFTVVSFRLWLEEVLGFAYYRLRSWA